MSAHFSSSTIFCRGVIVIMTKRRKLLVVVLVVAFLFGGGLAMAVPTFHTATSLTRAAVRTENAFSTHVNTAFVTVASVNLFAQAGSHIVARFSAESACSGGSGYCSARILVAGSEAEPIAGNDFAFDSTDSNRETASSWESHSMERVRTATVTGNQVIALQVAVVGTGVQLRLDDWTLSGWALAA